MKLTFTDFAIAFYLVLGARTIIYLLSLKQDWATATTAFTLGWTWLFLGYVLITRLQESQKIERILKTEVAQNAIAALAKSPGFDQRQAEKHIRAMCANTEEEDAEVMLMAIACMQPGNFIEVAEE